MGEKPPVGQQPEPEIAPGARNIPQLLPAPGPRGPEISALPQLSVPRGGSSPSWLPSRTARPRGVPVARSPAAFPAGARRGSLDRATLPLLILRADARGELVKPRKYGREELCCLPVLSRFGSGYTLLPLPLTRARRRRRETNWLPFLGCSRFLPFEPSSRGLVRETFKLCLANRSSEHESGRRSETELEASSGLAARVIGVTLKPSAGAAAHQTQQELHTPRHMFRPSLGDTNKPPRERHPSIYLAGRAKPTHRP